MYRIIITISGLFFLLAFNTPIALSATTQDCQPIYGGGETCTQAQKFSINLQIKNPQNSTYVDNLSASDPNYSPGQQIDYKIVVKNNNTQTLSKGTITLVFPQLVNYVSGDGTFDPKNRKLTFSIDKLEPNQSKVFFVTGKVVTKDKLPPQQGTVCTFTQVLASFDNSTSQDNNQFCIATTGSVLSASSNRTTTKGGLSVFPPAKTKKTPETGPEAWALFSLLPAGALGFWLRRMSIDKEKFI
jgi:hypothetical protein